MKGIEKLLEVVPKIDEKEEHKTIDTYAAGTIVLYTGSLRGFKIGSFGNIFTEYDLGELTGDSTLNGWKLQERFDFSGHSSMGPHINYGISGPNKGYFGTILGSAHSIPFTFK